MTDIKKEFLEGLTALLDKCFGPSEPEILKQKEVTKSLDEEKRLALFVVLEPQEGDLTTDAHGDTYSADEVEKACHDFSQHCMKAWLFHQVEIEDAEIVENYIAPVDLNIDGKEVKKGAWLQTWHFPETEVGEILWQAVKSGEINGVSIRAKANTVEIND